jgi:hypothetical protein
MFDGFEGCCALLQFNEPEDVSALRADVVCGFLIGPIEVEERSRACVQKRTAFMELLASADATRQSSIADLNLDCAVAAFDFLKFHTRRRSPTQKYSNIYRRVYRL